mmetsp:Transcript_22544/g.74745  ORF Transcript_22544/g.74745 Transcript_22544/m.74745 type:complete len:122 (+) Transcript_22544:2192-2557(+)
MPRGFIKSAPLPGFDPKLYPGPPMIWMSKRFVQPGRNPSIAAAFGKAQSRLWGERRGVMGHALYASLWRGVRPTGHCTRDPASSPHAWRRLQAYLWRNAIGSIGGGLGSNGEAELAALALN